MNLIARDDFFDLDKIFDGYLQPSIATSSSAKPNCPRVDIRELDNNYELIAELPGINKKNIAVTVENSILTIEAANTPASTEQNKYLRKERQLGKFSRSFKLGENIEQSAIAANFQDGLLILTIPKVEEAVVKPRKIEIH